MINSPVIKVNRRKNEYKLQKNLKYGFCVTHSMKGVVLFTITARKSKVVVKGLLTEQMFL